MVRQSNNGNGKLHLKGQRNQQHKWDWFGVLFVVLFTVGASILASVGLIHHVRNLNAEPPPKVIEEARPKEEKKIEEAEPESEPRPTPKPSRRTRPKRKPIRKAELVNGMLPRS